MNSDLLQSWIDLIYSELIFIPFTAGIALGVLVSMTPWIQNKKRRTDREWIVYGFNALGSGGAFLLINQDNIVSAMSMLIFVMTASVLVPMWWFRWRHK